MKRLRVVVVILFIIAAMAAGALWMARKIQEDKTLPVIAIPEDELTLSVSDDSKEQLMKGVKAWDEKDGDLTGHIYLQSIQRVKGNEMKAVYVVSDSDNHVVTTTRSFRYEDFMPPRFRLTAPLIYRVGTSIQLKDRVFAEDAVDGDISDRIRVYAGGLASTSEGTFPITLEVTNSFGDTSSVALNVVVRTPGSEELEIRLTEYLVYVENPADFVPEDYIVSVQNGKKSDVTVKMPKEGLVEGVNEVAYHCKNEDGVKGTTLLYVVVE